MLCRGGGRGWLLDKFDRLSPLCAVSEEITGYIFAPHSLLGWCDGRLSWPCLFADDLVASTGVYEWSRERSLLPKEEQGNGWPFCFDAIYLGSGYSADYCDRQRTRRGPWRVWKDLSEVSR